jgi:phosphohistidine phosphatase
MGRRIRELVGTLDLALISPTRRTQQTWELMNGELGHRGPVEIDQRIYDAWGGNMVDLVGQLPAHARTVLVLGHEPGVSELVLRLCGPGNPDLRKRVATKFPTCAVAVLSAAQPWAALRPGHAELQTFTTPKD